MKLSIEQLKAVAEIKGVKGYKSMSKNELLNVLTLSKPVKKGKKPKTNFSKARIEKIRKEFNESRYKFSKLKIKEIRQNLYKIENESKINKIERNLTELEENLSKTKKYYDYNDIECRGIKNVRDLFNLSIDEDYCKPLTARGAFDVSYIQYETKGDKGKSLPIKEYLNMIKSYLRNIINDHKTRGLVRYSSSNKSWLEETSSEWKIQLTMEIDFIPFKDFDDYRTMHTESNNVEIVMDSETDEIIEDLFESFFAKISRRVRRINERK